MSWEVRGDGEKPLLHLWSEQFNLTRRVLAITDHSEHRLALAVERFGRRRPDRLEFIRREFERGARELSQEEFRNRLSHLFAAQFPVFAILLPKKAYGTVAHRLAARNPQVGVELYDYDPALNILEKIDPRRAGNLDTWLVPHRESESLLKQAQPALDAIMANYLSPELEMVRVGLAESWRRGLRVVIASKLEV